METMNRGMKQSEPMRHLHPVIQLPLCSTCSRTAVLSFSFIRAKAHSQIPIIKCVGGSSNELCSIFGLETNLDLSVPNISRIEHLQKRHKHLWLSLDWYTPILSATVAQNMVIPVNHRQGLGMDFPSLVKNGTSGGGGSSIPRIFRLSIGNTFLQLIHSPFLFSALLRFPNEACTSNSDCSPGNIQKSGKFCGQKTYHICHCPTILVD